MKKIVPIAILLLSLGALSSCSTAHSLRYAYGETSVYHDGDTPEVSKAVWGLPLIVFSVGWDIVTFPAQALFGVWPWWGENAQSMVPDERETYSMHQW